MARLFALLLLLFFSTQAEAGGVVVKKLRTVMGNTETYTFYNNFHSVKITGRVPLNNGLAKLNPLWWYKNDFEPKAPSWYKPGEAKWWRQFSWYMRNPFQNAGRYVFGIADRNYTADSTEDIRIGGDLIGSGKTGCFRINIHHIEGFAPGERREFVSCTTKDVVWYAGTQWTGFYGYKFNWLHSPFQAW